jgi:DNA excision repair protein ERCC-2
MPSGTGKTITILALCLAYQHKYPKRSKLVYCSRTVPEIDKALLELKRLVAYREAMTGERMDFVGLGLSSRRNLCINEDVLHPSSSEDSRIVGRAVDSRCHSVTASWVRERAKAGEPVGSCRFFETLEETQDSLLIPSGVYTLEDLRAFGRQKGVCPYFLARKAMEVANVVIYSYYYLLDPKVADLVSRQLPREAIVVFDEAHNIDNVCIESLSIDIGKGTLNAAGRSLQRLSDRISELKATDAERLRQEYERLVAGLSATSEARAADRLMASPTLPDDLLAEAVPGSIRKGEHFVGLLRRFVEHLKAKCKAGHVIAESPLAFLQTVREQTCIERKPLRFCSERLGSLVRTLELRDLDELAALQRVAAFATLVATYTRGFLVLFEPFDDMAPGVSNPVLHLCCLDASLAIKPVFDRFQSVIITSGTLSPLEIYPKLLDFSPALLGSFPMSLARNTFSPLLVTRGADQVALTSRFDARSDPAVVRNYGALLAEFARIVPDGLVCFFPSYVFMETIVAAWQETGVLAEVLKHKLLFIETPDNTETAIALDNYRRACDSGRGAVLLSVARGKVSEGIDFDRHYGRAVLLFGIPYQYTESRILKARLEYLRESHGLRENDFLAFDALRHAAQCLGRVLRGKDDYGLMVLADRRYARQDKRAKLPRWLQQGIQESHVNLSVDMAVQLAKRFYREIAQPYEMRHQLGVTLLSVADLDKYKNEI